MPLDSRGSLTILILSNHKHKIPFHLFVVASLSSIYILEFSVWRSFTTLVNFIPKYFIVFDAVINRNVFLFLFFPDKSVWGELLLFLLCVHLLIVYNN